MQIQPRMIRLKDAPRYLGMCKNTFNELVRPFVTEIRYGSMSVGFDRLELDAWIEDYIRGNGRLGKQKGGDKPWRGKSYQGSSSAAQSGISTSSSEAAEFAKALERENSRKRKNT